LAVAEQPIEVPPPPAEGASPPPKKGPWWVRARAWLTQERPEMRVGTLRYTGFGLLMVFIWLLWGDFCYSLLEENLPQVLPLKLKQVGATDTVNAVVNKSMGYTVAFLLAPVISFRSDRTRTRIGRRIPYLLWSAPFMGLFLVLIGCYESITDAVTGGQSQLSILGYTLSRTQVAVAVLGVLIVGSDIAGIFANTVYYYLFNDVVPPRYIARFFGCFRVIATGATMAYNTWILPNSMTHFRVIFVLAGIGYAAGFIVMCIFVREGNYPPPPPNLDRRQGIVSSIKTFGAECFTHRLYWFFFIANALFFTSRATAMFTLIRNTNSLGLTLDEVKNVLNWNAGIALFLHLPAGWLADKFHPMRVYVWARLWEMTGTIAACVWIFRDFGHRGNLIWLYVVMVGFMPLRLIADGAELPMYMRLLPRERFGQFCSANGMIRAFVLIFGSVGAGMFIESMAPIWGERRYTWLAGWQLMFQLAAAFFMLLLYRQWRLHGGVKNYQPPQTGSAAMSIAPA
jgi:Na+/melibiose symporter-like transporter